MSVTITITDPSSTPIAELEAAIALLRNFVPTATFLVGGEPAGRVIGPVSFVPAVDDDVRAAAAQGAREAFAEAAAQLPSLFDLASTLVIPQPPVAAAGAFGTSSTPAPAGVELDKDALPWDGRIHASTKTKTVEGVWKKKRGVEQSVVDTVTAELRTVMAAPVAGAPAVAVPPPPPPAPVPAAEVHAASAIPSHELGGAVPPPPPAATGITFAEFMGHVTAGVTSARFTRENVSEACVKHGIPNLPGLINRPDLIPAVARELGLVA